MTEHRTNFYGSYTMKTWLNTTYLKKIKRGTLYDYWR